MKKHLLTFLCALVSFGIAAQCTPDFDFQGEEFGVSPNPEEGENFADGEANVQYNDVLHLKVPSDAGAVNAAFTGFPIDSVTISYVNMSDGGAFVPASNFGFEVNCNNDGVSPNSCTYLGGQQGCAELTGMPNVVDTLAVEVGLTFYTFFNNQVTPVPYPYDGYSLIIGGTISVDDRQEKEIRVSQNYPNPFDNNTSIEVDLEKAGEMNVTVLNLIGEKVLTKQVEGSVGTNRVSLSADGLEAGIYMYVIEFDGHSTTRRMVVGK